MNDQVVIDLPTQSGGEPASPASGASYPQETDLALPRGRALDVAAFVLSIGLAAYAQYQFSRRDSYWYDSVILYGLAMLLFIWVAGRALAPPAASKTRESAIARPSSRWAWPGGILVLASLLVASVAAIRANRLPVDRAFASTMILWVGGVALFGLALLPWPRLSSLPRLDVRSLIRPLRPYAGEAVWVAGLVLAALVLRAFDLGRIPFTFGGDEAEMGLQARSFLLGQYNDPFATSWFSHPTMFFFLQSLMLKLFGPTVPALRLLSALIGTASVLAAYLLVRQLHGRLLASLTGIGLAAYPFHIQFSRIGLNNIADPLWASAVFFLALRGLSTRRVVYFYAAGVALGFSQYFYHGVRLVPILLVVFLIFWFLQEPRVILGQLRNLGVMATSALLTVAPLALYYINNPHQFLERYDQQGIIPSGWLARQVAASGENPILVVADRTRRAFLMFNGIPDISGFFGPGTPLLGAVTGFLFVFGLAYALRHWRHRPFFLFLMWLSLGLFAGAVLIIDEAGSARLLTTTVPVMFLVALGAERIAALYAHITGASGNLKRLLLGTMLALIVFLNLQSYFLDYTPKRLYGGVAYANTLMADYLLNQPEPFKAYFFGPPFDYLTHGTIRYLYPNLDGEDFKQPPGDWATAVDTSREAIFLFIPARAAEFAQVQSRYPEGTRRDFKKENGELLFISYEVPRP